MSQVSLDKLSKKNKEFIHIATNQLLQDGKSDQEIQTILEGILPEILEKPNQGYHSPRPLRSPNYLGSFSDCKRAL